MKKVLSMILALFILACVCSCNGQSDQPSADPPSNDTFTKNEKGNIVSDAGVEYAHLANEGSLYYLGDLEFVGSIQGEEKTSQHLGLSYQTGMFAIKGANDNILIRRTPDNEWFSIYRKASLPSFDFAVDNCIRFEFVSGIGNTENDVTHTTCDDGIVVASEIAEFLSDVRSQKDPREAGLYDLIKKPDGMLENCYVYGVVYGFFGEEPNLAVRMDITSYNDLAYSISIDGKEYVLPAQWIEKLQNK